MTDQLSLVDDDRIPEERQRKYELDPTPGPMVEQLFHVLAHDWTREDAPPPVLPEPFERPRRSLDPCSGAGVFGQRIYDFWPDCYRVGVEIRDEEEENLAHNYDMYMLGDALEILKGPAIRGLAPFDLISTNPAFSLTRKLVRLALDLLTPRTGFLVFYGLNEVGQRGEEGNALFLEHPPKYQLRIPGSVKHRNGINPDTGKPYGADARSYSWWIWTTDHRGPGWTTFNLARLPSEARRWICRPGEEWRRREGDHG